MLGVVFSTRDLASLWAVFNTGEVLSAEWVSTFSKPVGRMYSPNSGLCWQASYNSGTGYGTWTQTVTGPLNTSCAAVTSAAWYTNATALSRGANNTAAGTISSGYIGITHMVHETSHDVVFGGEMDGRTLSNILNHGKPVQGEIYVVSATESFETLVAATESTVQSQLKSASAVDPSTVGNLAGSSASSLKSSFGSFYQMWSRSATVSMADSYGQVAMRCPSSTSPAYIALGASNSLYSSSQPSSLQPFQTQTNLQLILVSSYPSSTCAMPLVSADMRLFPLLANCVVADCTHHLEWTGHSPCRKQLRRVYRQVLHCHLCSSSTMCMRLGHTFPSTCDGTS